MRIIETKLYRCVAHMTTVVIRTGYEDGYGVFVPTIPKCPTMGCPMELFETLPLEQMKS